jgi:hypothetical protein
MLEALNRPLVRRPPMLADQGVVPVQAGALVEPAGPGLVAASPVEPAGGVPGGFGAAEGGAYITVQAVGRSGVGTAVLIVGPELCSRGRGRS